MRLLLLSLLAILPVHSYAQAYYKNFCHDKQVASWEKMNKDMKAITGKDHPVVFKKIQRCERFHQAIKSGKCKDSIALDKHGRSAEEQLKNGGPYNKCLQDVSR